MEWARRNLVRAIVVVVLVLFVLVEGAMGEWLWVLTGLVLLVLNFVLWKRSRTQHRGAGPKPMTTPVPLVLEPPVDLTLTELLDLPAVAAAWATGPHLWRQVSYLDEEENLQLFISQVSDRVWVTSHDAEEVELLGGHWSVAVGDDLKPLLDLDIEEDDDPLIATLLSHRAVAEAAHHDREHYSVLLRSPMSLDDMGVLAARGLIAHHLDAVRRLAPRA